MILKTNALLLFMDQEVEFFGVYMSNAIQANFDKKIKLSTIIFCQIPKKYPESLLNNRILEINRS